MSKTPTKSDTVHQFRAKELPTRNKDQQGITKTVYSHISAIHKLLSDWMKLKEKGVRIFHAVTALKLHECLDDYYPRELKPLILTLLEILDKLKIIVEGFSLLRLQLQALAQLQSDDEPAISTWSVSKLSKNVDEIVESLEKEYKLKTVIIDNVAHCRNEHLLEVYVSAWEFEVYLNFEAFAYLFAEAGLAGVS